MSKDQQKKNWDQISSDEDNDNQYDEDDDQQLEQQKSQNDQQGKEKNDEEHKQGDQQDQNDEQKDQAKQDGPKKEFKKLPTKGEIIQNIKNQEGNQVSIQIIRVEQKVESKQIYEAYKHITIKKIYKNQQRQDKQGFSQFTIYFDDKQQAINFVKSPAQPLNGKNFILKYLPQKQNMTTGWQVAGEQTEQVQTNKPNFYNSEDMAQQKLLNQPKVHKQWSGNNKNYDNQGGKSFKKPYNSYNKNNNNQNFQKPHHNNNHQQEDNNNNGENSENTHHNNHHHNNNNNNNNYHNKNHYNKNYRQNKDNHEQQEQEQKQQQQTEEKKPEEQKEYKPKGFTNSGSQKQTNTDTSKRNQEIFGSAKPIKQENQQTTTTTSTKTQTQTKAKKVDDNDGWTKAW